MSRFPERFASIQVSPGHGEPVFKVARVMEEYLNVFRVCFADDVELGGRPVAANEVVTVKREYVRKTWVQEP